MPEELKETGETPSAETVTETAGSNPEQKTVTAEELQAELEQLRRQLTNKSEEAARLHNKIKEREDAELSETEKIKKQLAEAQAELAATKRREIQRDVAEKTGLPAAFASRIQGETPEEMEADAKALLEAMPKAPKQPINTGTTNPPSSGKPVETDEQKRKRIFG